MAARSPLGAAPARRWIDRLATGAIRAGGLLVIVSLLGILLSVVLEVAPLGRRARVTPGPSLPAALAAGVSAPGAVATDPSRAWVALLGADGRARVLRLADGVTVAERALVATDEPFVAVSAAPGEPVLAGVTADGSVVAARVTWGGPIDEGGTHAPPGLDVPHRFETGDPAVAAGPFTVRLGADGGGTAAVQAADGRILLLERPAGPTGTAQLLSALPCDRRLSALVLDGDARALYGATAAGELLWWDLARRTAAPLRVAGGAPVTALGLLIGDRSLVVGRGDGTLEIWFPLRPAGGSRLLQRARELPALAAAVRAIAPSGRDKGFLALDAAGTLGLYHSTSGRLLWRGTAPLPAAAALTFAPKGDGAAIAGAGGVALLDIDNPHPAVSLRTLFGPVWYEGYEAPRVLWQSTGGSDDFEPKLSLTPLIAGTLKSTACALVVAIPLAVLGALYTAQFMHPTLARWVKPAVEIMAALPSVVLGFLAGVWLAPRLEDHFPAFAAAACSLPFLVVGLGLAWRTLPAVRRHRVPAGAELGVYALGLLVLGWVAVRLDDRIEALLFAGDFSSWLHEATGLAYDQRNAIVVGLAMGFAVIPVVFSIAEDAFSTVPPSLVTGSLALGANRWETATRVVLPTASPGVLSAVVIGCGRAVGETMIVLLAAGNTPLLGASPFEGLRTLAANLAIEIPETPHGATLHRTLFLAALLLLLFTFLLNTVAELVRQRLRRRYARL